MLQCESVTERETRRQPAHRTERSVFTARHLPPLFFLRVPPIHSSLPPLPSTRPHQYTAGGTAGVLTGGGEGGRGRERLATARRYIIDRDQRNEHSACTTPPHPFSPLPPHPLTNQSSITAGVFCQYYSHCWGCSIRNERHCWGFPNSALFATPRRRPHSPPFSTAITAGVICAAYAPLFTCTPLFSAHTAPPLPPNPSYSVPSIRRSLPGSLNPIWHRHCWGC